MISATASAGKLESRDLAFPVAGKWRAKPWFWFLRAAIFAWLVSGASPADAKNLVVAFFDHAEVQFESQAQGDVIQTALNDLLNKPALVLKRLRYPDYTGARDQWTALQVVSHYFVPRTPVALDDNTFYADIGSPESKQVIRNQLRILKQMMKYY